MALDVGHHSEKVGHGRCCVDRIVDVVSYELSGRHDKERGVCLQTESGCLLVHVARFAWA